ncbi:MAG: rod-binding protein [Pseudomonadota bacterium]
MTDDAKGVRAAAEKFERVFLSQMLTTITAGLESSEGHSLGSDDPYASMLREQYADLIAKSGGIGISDAVMRQLLRAQEQN